MSRAILDGRKTQTRRPIAPQPIGNADVQFRVCRSVMDQRGRRIMCPCGDIGDTLWVRETWAEAGIGEEKRILYRADGDALPPGARWRPSIHMPRSAARITLMVLGVRVERVECLHRHRP